MDLSREEDSFFRGIFVWLNPRVAANMHDAFNVDAIQIQLLLVLVTHCDGSWHPKFRIHLKLNFVTGFPSTED